MSELAAQLVDRVLPHVPIRQWVFTVPMPVRYLLAFDAALTRAVLRVFLRIVFGWLRQAAVRQGVVRGCCGVVTAIQRFLPLVIATAGRPSVEKSLHAIAPHPLRRVFVD